MRLTYDVTVDGWWIVESPGWRARDRHFCWRTTVRQIKADDERSLELHRGPYPTREMAEDHQYEDILEAYWKNGLTVYADHCLSCGSFAKVLAFDSLPGFAWRVTECRACGVRDSRV